MDIGLLPSGDGDPDPGVAPSGTVVPMALPLSPAPRGAWPSRRGGAGVQLPSVPLPDDGAHGPLDPAVNADLDAFLGIARHDDDDEDKQRCAKKPCAVGLEEDSWFDFMAADGSLGAQHVPPALPEFLTEFALPLPPPQVYPSFMRGAEAKRMQPAAGSNGSSQNAAERECRRRISENTVELTRFIPGGH